MSHTSLMSKKNVFDFREDLDGFSLKNKAVYLTDAIILKLSSYGLLQRVGLHVDFIVTHGRAASIFMVIGLNSQEYYKFTLKKEVALLSEEPESVYSCTRCSKQEEYHLRDTCSELKMCEWRYHFPA